MQSSSGDKLKSNQYINESFFSKFSFYYSIFTIIITSVTFLINSIRILVWGNLIIFIYLLIVYRQELFWKDPNFKIGIANLITLLRFLATLILGIYYFNKILTARGSLILSIAFFVIAVFDKVDGIAARLLGEESDFGAYFDIETDGLTTLITSILLFKHDIVDIWIIGLGLLRYIYILALSIASWFMKVSTSESTSKLGAFIGVAFTLSLGFGFLINVKDLTELIPEFEFFLLSGIKITSILVCFSFMRSFLQKFK